MSAENDHTMKANKLLTEKIEAIKKFISEMHTIIKEAQESRINLSLDHVNMFERVEKILLDKKLSNFEMLLNKAIEAGAFVEDLIKNIQAYKTKAFPYSYANPSKEDQAESSPAPKRKEKFILTDKQKKDKLIDSIFSEMRSNQKIPGYYLNSINKLDKLKLIRDHFESIYKK